MPFLCREIPFLLAWPVICEILKGLRIVKDLGLSSHPQRGKREKGALQGVEVQSCAPHWHLLPGSCTWGSCRWGKCRIKAKWVIHLEPGLQCPSPWGWSPAGLGAPVLLQPTQQRAQELVCSHSEIYFKALSIRQHQLEFLRQIHL